MIKAFLKEIVNCLLLYFLLFTNKTLNVVTVTNKKNTFNITTPQNKKNKSKYERQLLKIENEIGNST